ncbi:MAG TPA: TonB-dependent receptor [Opitutaceae bacterium]
MPALLRFHRQVRRPARFLAACLTLAGALLGGAQTVPLPAASVPTDVPIVVLDEVLVQGRDDDEGYDPTGMGAREVELYEPPFANDLLLNDVPDDELSGELTLELGHAAGASPAELATGTDRVNLRGFPTPRLRNGFAQTGIPEVLDVERAEMIQGPLTPVLGLGAPGGIQNFVTARPRARPLTRVQLSVTSEDLRRARLETTGVTRPKKAWHRVALAWERKDGPETFATRETVSASVALTWKHSRAASTLVQVAYSGFEGNPSPGVPEYRASRNTPILGPYRPLADFHAYGPDSGVRRRTASASAQFEAQASRHVSVRASLVALTRELDEERFTKGEYLLDTGKFGGTREPQHIEQPLDALAAQAEATLRFAALGADHKLLLSLENIFVDYRREQRALTTADRTALLPADVRTFDPEAPNYFRPAYDPALYRRVITDREEETTYTGVALSERAAFAGGRLVATAGSRYDVVGLDLADHRAEAVRPRVSDSVEQVTWHAGANYIAVPRYVLVFANTSTAFEPSTRVDARTGRIQGNETTGGFELGAKGVLAERRVSYTAHLFSFVNENISRRNPLYNDPIADAALTQPELVAAGEERFTGGSVDVRAKLSVAWQFVFKTTYTRAITTKSPDLPEEEGRELTRLPRLTGGLTARYQVPDGRWKGLNASSTLTYVSGFVQTYETSNRAYLEYPDYTLVSLNTGYVLKRGRYTHNVGVSVRNLFDRDLLAQLARPGAGRELGMNYTLTF